MPLQYSDRSFQYGDGLFSTIRIEQGRPQLWPLHWQRLLDSMRRLGFVPPSEAQVLAEVTAAISAEQQVLKVLISRGHGARGYGTAGIEAAEIHCWTAALPDYQRWRQQGVYLGLAELRLARQPLLAGIKHCSRLETVLLKREQEQSRYDELLALDHAGSVIEACSANVLCWRDEQWYTPELSQAGVAGVMRQLLLEHGDVKQVQWSLAELQTVEAMALCNALMGVVPVYQFSDKPLQLEPGLRLQQQADQWLKRYSA